MNLRVKRPIVDLEEFERRPDPFASAPSTFDINAVLHVLRARRNVILGTAGAVVAAALLVLLFVVPTYSATAVMMIDQRRNAVADVNAVLSGLATDSASVQNQIQILTSRQLAARVVDTLALHRDPEFNTQMSSELLGTASAASDATSRIPINGTDKVRDAAITRLLKRLSVEQLGLSSTMTISVASVDAAKSARITNAIADAYIEDQLNSKFEATRKAATWLSQRVRQMAEQVQADEAAVQTYKAKRGIVDTPGGSIIDQQTASVNVQLINAKADLAQKIALYDRAIELQRAGRAVEASQVVASPLIAQLRAQEAELRRQEAQLASRYLPQHPKMVDVRSQRRDTRVKINAEVSRVIDSLASDVAVGRANVKSLEDSLAQLQSKFQVQGNDSVALKALESIAASSRSNYEALLSRLKEVQGQEGIAAADARIISRAMEPTTSSPRPLLVLGVALPASLVLGLMFAFFAEALDPSLRTREHVDRHVGVPVLTTVPEVSDEGARHGVASLVVYEPSSSFSEAIRGLYLGLSLSDAERTPKVLLVTSAVPGEGKTVIAVSLARLAARNGRRVLIVDADFRRPAVARTMGVTSPPGSVVDVLEGRLPVERCIVGDGQSQAAVLSGSDKPINPSDLLTSDALEKLMVQLRGRYDLVIVDSAPVVPVHDTLALARLCDATVFVTHSGKTPREAVATALKSLRSMSANVAGVVLTRTRLDPRYDYHDYLYSSQLRRDGQPALPPRTWASVPAELTSALRKRLTRSGEPPMRSGQ
ncbi:MAG: polysaccharide biosynthesis tyrosine autokinase [Alphaproteobacteria bacterium]|nr:polysaccharide biosynthesis tyrosine autokinase [Alphaproteobacteria bacterium]